MGKERQKEGLGLDHSTEPYLQWKPEIQARPTAVTYYIDELDYRPPDEVVGNPF